MTIDEKLDFIMKELAEIKQKMIQQEIEDALLEEKFAKDFSMFLDETLEDDNKDEIDKTND